MERISQALRKANKKARLKASKKHHVQQVGRADILKPEQVDKLLNNKLLYNPHVQQEQTMKVQNTLGEQLRAAIEKKTQLESTLNAWDADEQKQIKGEVMETTKKHLFGVSNNATRETFNYVRDNPHLKVIEIVKALAKHGFKESTVSSLVYQMIVVGLLAKDSNGMGVVATAPEFVPYNIAKVRRDKELAQLAKDKEAQERLAARKFIVVKRRTEEDVAKAQAAAGIGSLAMNVDGHKAGMGTFKQHQVWKPEDTVDLLTLMQAKAVHAYLQKLFGAL
jgi:hypothetical protein